jgi:hypothetical protein
MLMDGREEDWKERSKAICAAGLRWGSVRKVPMQALGDDLSIVFKKLSVR